MKVFSVFSLWRQRAALLAGLALGMTAAFGQAAEPGKDHPLVGRYEGATLKVYQKPKFDEIGLLQGPVNVRDTDHPDVLKLEGNVSFYYYELPKERSSLEVQRNYEESLKAKGLDIVFSCGVSNGSCFTDQKDPDAIWFSRGLEKATRWPNFGQIGGVPWACETGTPRYTLAKREADSGVTHVSIAICDRVSPGQVFIAVVESKAMDTGKIAFVNASDMQKSLDATGRVNLYGIYFDTDKDTIKPESKPTLDEIGKLMKDNPQLRLQVVGHTDSTGGEAHNKDLSNRRAASVTHALAVAGIDAKRFASRGAGAAEPVQSNDTEEGRAKNRRVELVRM